MHPHSAQSGFSLVELSIVLVILGLLTGGILGGQALIRAAELRAVGTEYSRWVTATQTFRDKYFAIPGDMRNATQFWGRMNSNADCVTNSSAAVVSTGVCDGNGTGTINQAGAPSQVYEGSQFWRQLAAAGLIEGTFSGLAGSAGTQNCVIGTDCPRSRLPNAGWGPLTLTNYAGDTWSYAYDYGNTYRFGAKNTAAPGGAVLKPEEAWGIDTKLDDGRPASGTVIAMYWDNSCSTSTANNDYTGTYKLTDNSVRCALYFPKAF